MKDGPSSFPLRLPRSTRLQAIEVAQNEGLSLNQFIALAVTEKIVRLERLDEASQSHHSVRHRDHDTVSHFGDNN